MQGHALLAIASAPTRAAVSRAVRATTIMTIIATMHPGGASG
nr:hypothetical protein [uncultured Sphingomonas sp.]